MYYYYTYIHVRVHMVCACWSFMGISTYMYYSVDTVVYCLPCACTLVSSTYSYGVFTGCYDGYARHICICGTYYMYEYTLCKYTHR